MGNKITLKRMVLILTTIVLIGLFSCGNHDNTFEQPVLEESETKDYSITLSTARDYVDLALPSGTKWANMNVGASSNADPGGYYMWGETTEFSKAKYTFQDSVTYEYMNIGRDISGTKYDVARVLWGEGWKMPTLEQYIELCQYCDYGEYSLSGHSGYVFVGRNGNRIFMPSGGCLQITGSVMYYPYYEDLRTIELYDPHEHYYWSSSDNIEYDSQAWCWHNLGRYNMGREFGCNVRAIKE